MTYDELIAHFGTEAAAAAARETDRQKVHAWGKRGRIPIDEQIQYEILTAGALRAEVPEEFRALSQQPEERNAV